MTEQTVVWEALGQEVGRLRDLRNRKGIPLSDIAQQTCISRCYLEAIEASEWGRLPEGVYRANYVRQYAQAIDPEQDASFVSHALVEPAAPIAPALPWWRKLAERLRA